MEREGLITISRVEVSAQPDGAYSISLDWKQPPQSYQSLFLVISQNGAASYYEIHMIYGGGSGYVKNITLSPDGLYTAALAPGPDQACISGKIPIICGQYTDVKARYDGRELTLNFTPPRHSSGGELHLYTEDGASMAVSVAALQQSLRLPLDEQNFPENGCWQLCLTACASAISFGPAGKELRLYYALPKLKCVDISGDTVVIDCVICGKLYDDRSQCSLRAALLLDGKEHFVSQPYTIQASGDKTVSLEAAIPSAGRYLAKGREPSRSYVLALYACGESTINLAVGQNSIPLYTPSPTVSFKGKTAILTWKDEPDMDFIVRLGRQESKISGNSYLIEDVTQNEASVQVAAEQNGTRGPFSNPVSLFRPGYYPQKDETGTRLVLCRKSFHAASPEFLLGDDLFPTPLAEPVDRPPFHLAVRNGCAYVTVSQVPDGAAAKEAFTEFLKVLMQYGMTADGYYRLRQLAARSAGAPLPDMLSYLDGGFPHAADLFPGVCLCVESEAYQSPQSRDTGGSGYSLAGTGAYWIEFNRLRQSLTCHCGLNRFFSSAHSRQDMTIAGGITDLSDLQKPFGRLLYPPVMPSADQPETPFASDHICLAAGNDPFSLPETPEQAAEAVWFRGRAAMWLEICIFINGYPQRVPLGTTLENLINRLGMTNPRERLCMMRETGEAYGKCAQIFLDWDVQAGAWQLPLFPGDRIDCLPGADDKKERDCLW